MILGTWKSYIPKIFEYDPWKYLSNEKIGTFKEAWKSLKKKREKNLYFMIIKKENKLK